jgi:hypothetical protein
MKKLTRRNLAGAVLSAAAAARAAGQTQPAAEDDLKLARERLKATADVLSRREIPMSTEPAFQFKA